MCGRYALETSVPEIARILDAEWDFELAPRYNVAPTQSMPVCRIGADGRRRLALLRWGLVPSWAKEAGIGARLINARAETVATKPAFRTAFRRRRCLVPADGYYEWRRLPGGRKQPYYVHAADGGLLALAGLWERWEGGGEPLESFTIVTTAADATSAAVHDRMPALLAPDAWAAWLDPARADAAALGALLGPAPPGVIALHPVATLVNDPRHDEPRCREPLAGPG